MTRPATMPREPSVRVRPQDADFAVSDERRGSAPAHPAFAHPAFARPVFGRERASPPAEPVLPGAYDLLSAALSRLQLDSLSIVQFLPLTGENCVRPVAAAFAAASAAAHGRTLLLDVSGAAGGMRRQDFGSVAAESEPLVLRRAMTPDMARPGLHYAAAQPCCAADLHELAAKVARSTSGQAAPFRMLVLDEAAPLARERACMLSAGCNVTIPVAIAGRSRLPQMRETLRRLRAAGATLGGLVLLDVPPGPGMPRPWQRARQR